MLFCKNCSKYKECVTGGGLHSDCGGYHPIEEGWYPNVIDGLGYKVVTLCGSTKFKEDFMRIQRELTLKGYIVLSVGIFGHADGEYCKVITPDVKRMLDDMHKRKIDMADIVYVINRDGYIGKSTANEIKYATSKGKPIRYMELPEM